MRQKNKKKKGKKEKQTVVGAGFYSWGFATVKYRCESCRQIIKRCFNRTFPITILKNPLKCDCM